MMVETRKLNATETKGDRIKVVADDGATAEFPYPYRDGLDGREAHVWAVRRLFPTSEFDEPMWVRETEHGEVFCVPNGEKLTALDKITMKDVMRSMEDRKAAFRRHNQRSGKDNGAH